MGKTSILAFILEWIGNESFRQKVLHKEVSEMAAFGLDSEQIRKLTRLKPGPIGRQIAIELGVDLEEVRNAVFPQPDSDELSSTADASTMASVAAAGYDEGRTHIRRVRPGIVPVSTRTAVVLWGQGFRWEPARITVEFRQNGATVNGTVTKVDCGVDVWQRVHVAFEGLSEGLWQIFAHNDDDWKNPADHSQGYLWSSPFGNVLAR